MLILFDNNTYRNKKLWTKSEKKSIIYKVKKEPEAYL